VKKEAENSGGQLRSTNLAQLRQGGLLRAAQLIEREIDLLVKRRKQIGQCRGRLTGVLLGCKPRSLGIGE
jgi:hypothetical protein